MASTTELNYTAPPWREQMARGHIREVMDVLKADSKAYSYVDVNNVNVRNPASLAKVSNAISQTYGSRISAVVRYDEHNKSIMHHFAFMPTSKKFTEDGRSWEEDTLQAVTTASTFYRRQPARMANRQLGVFIGIHALERVLQRVLPAALTAPVDMTAVLLKVLADAAIAAAGVRYYVTVSHQNKEVIVPIEGGALLGKITNGEVHLRTALSSAQLSPHQETTVLWLRAAIAELRRPVPAGSYRLNQLQIVAQTMHMALDEYNGKFAAE